MKHNKKELREKLTRALNQECKLQESLIGEDNPQLVALYNISLGRTEVLDAVLGAMQGSHVLLDILVKNQKRPELSEACKKCENESPDVCVECKNGGQL